MGGAVGGSDFTHLTETGANITAGIICGGIKTMNIPLAKEVSACKGSEITKNTLRKSVMRMHKSVIE